MTTRWRAVLKGLSPLMVALVLWQQIGDPASSDLPPPSIWWHAVLLLVRGGTLLPATIATVSALLAGLLAASIVGLALGVMLGSMPTLRHCSSWLLEYCRAIPPPVMIPIAVLLLGYTGTMEVIVVAFGSFWSVLLNTVSGVLEIRPLTYDMAKSLRLTRRETMLKIVLPATLPAFLLGVRVALPHAVIITLVVEMFTGAVGLGGLMIAAERNFNAGGVFGLLVLVGLLGALLNAGFNAIETIFVRRWPVRGGHLAGR